MLLLRILKTQSTLVTVGQSKIKVHMKKKALFKEIRDPCAGT